MMGQLRNLNRVLAGHKPFDLYDRSIILGYRGSIVHGTYDKQPHLVDDKDVLGVCIPPDEYYLGMGKFEQYERLPKDDNPADPWDIVIYEFHKYVRLLIKSNPNVLSLLWLPEMYYLHIKPEGQVLIDNRNLFVSKAAYHSFSGYAYGQLKRMTKREPNWRMGAKRKVLFEKFGYDTKNASHLIRLLKMGTEFLVEGELFVVRKDASMLLEIKRGEWPLKKVEREAERLFRQCEDAYQKSSLPNNPDREKIVSLVHELTRSFLKH